MTTRDELNSMHPAKAVQAAYNCASQMQDFRKAEQIAGVALFLNELCLAKKLDVSELFNQVGRMAKDADTFFQRETKALRDYIQGEF